MWLRSWLGRARGLWRHRFGFRWHRIRREPVNEFDFTISGELVKRVADVLCVGWMKVRNNGFPARGCA